MLLQRPLEALKLSYATPIRLATIGSVIAAITAQLILVVSGIALARLLGPVDRGYIALLVLWPGVLFQIVGIGLSWSLTYHIASRLFDAGMAVRALARPFALQVSGLLLAHTLILLIYLRGKPSDVVIAGILTLPLGPAYLVWDYSLGVLQGLRNFLSLNLLRLLPSLLVALIAVIMLIVRDRSLTHLAAYITLSNVGSAFITAAIAWTSIRSFQPLDTIGSTRRELVTFGLRGYLGSLYPLDSFRLDQVIVGVFLSASALGLYVVGSSFTSLPRFLAQNVALIALPHVASKRDSRARRLAVVRFVAFGTSLAIVAVVLLEATVAFLLPLFFGVSFTPSIQVAQILLVGALCLSVRRVLAESLKGAGFPLAGTIAEATAWLVLLPILVWAVRIGILGVAWSVSLSFAVSLFVLVALAIRFDWRMPATQGSSQ